MKGPTILLAFGTIFTVIALGLVAVSFATEHWQDTTVDRKQIRTTATVNGFTTVLSDLDSNPLYFTRYRGLFRTCYPGNETTWLDTAAHRIDGWCISEQGYELSRDSNTLSYGDSYDARIHLMRAHFAFYVVSMLFLVVAAILTGVGCWTLNSSIIKTAGAIVAIGAFFASGGIALFHGYEYLENNKILAGSFYANIKDDSIYSTLVNNMDTQYGYSYILGWVGIGCAFIAAILCLCTGFSVAEAKRDDEKAALAGDNYTLSNSGLTPRNKAYEYAENNMLNPYGVEDPAAQQVAAAAIAANAGYPTAVGNYPYGYDYGGYRY